MGGVTKMEEEKEGGINEGRHPAGSQPEWQSDRWRGLAWMCVCVCLCVSASRALGTGGSPVLLMSWQVGPTLTSPNPTPLHCHPVPTQHPTVSFIPSQGSIWSVQPHYAPVRGWMCGSLKIPICCPWLGARGAGNGRLWCRKYRGIVEALLPGWFSCSGLESAAWYLCWKLRELLILSYLLLS